MHPPPSRREKGRRRRASILTQLLGAVLRNTVLAASAVFGTIAFVIRWRELFYPSLCRRKVGQTDKDTVGGDSFGWGMFRRSEESSYPSKNQRQERDSVEPRLSDISDLTLDEAIRTPPNQM